MTFEEAIKQVANSDLPSEWRQTAATLVVADALKTIGENLRPKAEPVQETVVKRGKKVLTDGDFKAVANEILDNLSTDDKKYTVGMALEYLINQMFGDCVFYERGRLVTPQ